MHVSLPKSWFMKLMMSLSCLTTSELKLIQEIRAAESLLK